MYRSNKDCDTPCFATHILNLLHCEVKTKFVSESKTTVEIDTTFWREHKLWTHFWSHKSIAWHRECSRADDQTTETLVFTGEGAYHKETNQLVVCAKAVGLGCTLILHRMSSSTISRVICCVVLQWFEQINSYLLPWHWIGAVLQWRWEEMSVTNTRSVSIHFTLV